MATKARYWAMAVYPESAHEQWQDKLKLTGLAVAISPLHDKDIKVDGSDEDKKPHWHVLMCWGNTTTKSAAQAVADSIGGVLMPTPLNSVRGYYRYLTHKDDPDKHQYDDADIQHLGGFDAADYIDLTRGEIERQLDAIEDYIQEHDIREYADLMEWLKADGLQELRRAARRSTIHFRGYLASRKHRQQPTVDPTTGEVLG